MFGFDEIYLASSKESNSETVSDSETSDVKTEEKPKDKEILGHTETVESAPDYDTLVAEVRDVSTSLDLMSISFDNVTNVLIVVMVGLALLVGVVCASIMSRFFRH